jgi:soluble lytic murein transglycosylase-like protein|tara:strand:- start:51785 stop:52375 length:591 start_codon:yes stop_codon:yes gene_type:complete
LSQFLVKLILFVSLLLLATQLYAGGQREEALSNSVKAVIQKSVSNAPAPRLVFANSEEGQAWLAEMSQRLQKRIPDKSDREDFLISVQYEATRAGLDPQLVLSLIQMESVFNKCAVSRVGARGYMQVMPFWAKKIGNPDHNLFDLRLNLRYGCTILRHYMDIEHGNLFRALGRYNGSLGKSKYPNLVISKHHKSWN